MSAPVIITLDGPAGVGKSTVARLVAETLGYPYLNTGAIYRTLALRLGEGAEKLEEQSLRDLCGRFRFQLEGSGADTRLLVNADASGLNPARTRGAPGGAAPHLETVPVGDEIRSESVGARASRLAAVPVVRECLLHVQRRLGETSSLVAEGRDMGTRVFPDARHKFFLDAAPEVRAERRCKELRDRGEPAALADLADQIRRRDAVDRARAVDPLRPAPDAAIIDTSRMPVEAVVEAVLRAVAPRGESVCRSAP